MVQYSIARSMLRGGALVIILACFLSFNGLAENLRGPLNPVTSTKELTAQIEASLDLGNLEVEQTAVTIAKDYPASTT